MTIQATRSPPTAPAATLDADGDPARLPDPRAGDQRPPLVYLDSASTSQKPQRRHRRDRRPTTASTTRTSTAGSTRSARGRPPSTRRPARRSARFINAPDAHEVVFTRNATEAINLVAYSWGRKNIDRGDAIVLTEMEHHANLVPWQLLVQERDGDLEFIPITDDGAAPARRLRGAAAAEAEARRVHPRLEHARHDQPGPRDGRDGPRGGRARPRRRRAGRAARAGRRPGARRRLLRVQRPQDARPDGLRRAVGPARAARGDAAVPGRRRDDPRGPPPPVATGTTSRGSSRRARRTSATRSGSAWRPST